MTPLQQLLNQVKDFDVKDQRAQVIELLPDNVLTEYNNHELYSASAHAWWEKGDLGRAYRDFSRAIALSPETADYYTNRGAIMMYLKEYETAISDFNKAIKYKTGNALAHFNRGEALKAMDKHEEAMNDYNMAIKGQPDFALAYLGRGYIFYLEQEFDKAIREFDKVISLDATLALAWYNRGNAWAKKERYNKAIEDFTKSISLDPTSANTWCDRGWAYFDAKQYDKALADFEKVIAMDGAYAPAYYGRGEVWYEKDEFAKAVEDYTKYIDLRPYEALGYNNRGYAWRAMKEFDKAIEDFTLSIGLDPSSASEYFSRGLAQFDKLHVAKGARKNFEMAIKDFDDAIRLEPDYGEAYCKRGLLWASIDEYNKAIKDFNMALQLDPADKAARHWLDEVIKKQKSLQRPENDQDVQAIREQAAGFIDEIRHHLSATCKIDKDRFLFGWYVSEWDKKNKQPLVAGVQSWLPEVRPDIAKWAEVKDHEGKKHMGVCTHDGEEFYPSLAGIPIKKDLWRAITQVRGQFRIGEKLIHEVKSFAIVNRLLERVVQRIRSGQLDHEIVFGEYRLPTVMEEFESMLKKMINTPPMPRKKK